MAFSWKHLSCDFCLGIFIVLALSTQNSAAVASADASPCDPADRPCANGGTCLSLPDGSRICQCPNGWIGANCSEDLDECESAPCRNGATCINMLNRKFDCVCPVGFVGTLCEHPDPCISRKCKAGATCSVLYTNWTERICTCQPGFTGDDCGEDLNECQLASKPPCLNGGRCENTQGSYRCVCQPGYLGFDCSELEYADCKPDPCLNGGTCVLDHSGKEMCVCPAGVSGANCQMAPSPQVLDVSEADCRREPCQHGGRCVEVDRGNFSCRCPGAFSGSLCESVRQLTPGTRACSHSRCRNGATCIIRTEMDAGLPAVAGEDNSYSCLCSRGFRGRHCEFAAERSPEPTTERPSKDAGSPDEAVEDPWSACPVGLRRRCRAVFADGHCDPKCNSSACLADGFDCAEKLAECPAEVRARCIRVLADGFCDPQCNSSACLLDGGDCLKSASEQQPEAAAVLTLLVAATRDDLQAVLSNLTSQLSRSLRLILRRDGDFEEDATSGQLRLRLRVLACIDADGADCVASTASGREAARLLTELLRRGRLQPILPLSVVADPLKPPSTQPPVSTGDGQLVALLIGICSLLACGLLVGVLYTAVKRKRVATKGVWHPPGFRPSTAGTSLTAGAAAAGQDSSSMSLSLSSSSSPLETLVQCSGSGSGVTCRLLGPPVSKRAKYENTSFLSSSLLPTGGASLMPTSASNDELRQVAETPLHLAARYCRADATRHLLECGADPNCVDQFGRTPLHLAIASGAHGAALLLMGSHGADLNARADDGATPLIAAAKYGELEIASSLLACPQVDPGAVDSSGKTALHWAASVNAGDLVALLLCRGANRDPPDAQERTPLYLAVFEGAAGAAARLLEAGANRDACDSCGRSPVQAAEARLHLDIARMLRFQPPPLQTPPPPPLQAPPPPPLQAPPPPPPRQSQLPPPPPQRHASLATASQCDYSLSQQSYPLRHYPTPPSHPGLEDSPPQFQPQQQQQQLHQSQHLPPPLPPHQTKLVTGHQPQQQQQQQLQYPLQQQLQQQQQPSTVGFLTPSPDSGQDSPGQSSGTSFLPTTPSYFTHQRQQPVAYDDSNRFFN